MSDDTHEHSARHYYLVFGALLLALVVSLVMAAVWGGATMVATIFLIASVKAYLVVSNFMHLKLEPKWIKVLMLSMLAALVALFVGVYIDVVAPFGGGEGS